MLLLTYRQKLAPNGFVVIVRSSANNILNDAFPDAAKKIKEEEKMLLPSTSIALMLEQAGFKEVELHVHGLPVQCTMSPLSTRNCFKSSKVGPISNCWFCRLIYKKICLNVFESKQRREKLVFVIL